MLKFEKTIIELLEKHYLFIVFLIISIFALLIRISLFKNGLADYLVF